MWPRGRTCLCFSELGSGGRAAGAGPGEPEAGLQAAGGLTTLLRAGSERGSLYYAAGNIAPKVWRRYADPKDFPPPAG